MKYLLSFIVFLCGLTLNAQTSSINYVTSNSFKINLPSIRFYGATNNIPSADNALTLATSAAGEVIIPQGTYNITNNFTVAQTNILYFEQGGLLKPASGVTVTIKGGVKAGAMQKIFDISAGGKILFENTPVITENDKIWAGWWGPDNNNLGTTGDNTKLQAWLSSTTTSVATEKWIGPGFYTVTSPLLVSNKFIVKGLGMPTITGNLSPNTSVIKVADAADDVRIDGLGLSGFTISGTNCFGIEIGLDCDRPIFSNLRISGKLYGGGIYNSGNSLYPTFRDIFTTTLDNTVANGGNGLYPAAFVKSTNVFSVAQFFNCKVINCNAGLIIDGGAATNSGNIHWEGGGFEGVGWTGLSTNVITLNRVSQMDVVSTHFENCTNVNLIQATYCKQLNVTDTLMSGDYSASVKTTNMITVNQVGTVNVRGGRMSHPLSYFIVNSGTTKSVQSFGTYFDIGGYTMASDAEIDARMSGNVLWNYDPTATASGTYTPTLTIVNNLDSVTPQLCTYSRVGNTVTVAGWVDVDATAGGATYTLFYMTLPVPSNFTTYYQCGGNFVSNATAKDYGWISTGLAGKAGFAGYFNGVGAQQLGFTFTYQVLP